MCRLSCLIILILTLVTFAVSSQRGVYVIPVKDNIPIYVNQVRKIHENAHFTAGLKSRLKVLSKTNKRYQVQDQDGRIGWVERHFVVLLSNPTQMKFDSASVYSYNDIRRVIFINDATDPSDVAIKLDRTFQEALKENIDRECLERVLE